MAYEDITRHGWFSRIRESLKGMFAGFIVLAVAVVLQFWNEGRTLKREQTLAEASAQVLDVASGTPVRDNDGRLVHVVGQARAGAPLTDEIFGVERQALGLRRHVEMYQWRERKEKREEKTAGGGTREVTRYSYEQRWLDEPLDSSRFKEADAHRNPDGMPYRDASWRAADIHLGGFRLDAEAAAEIGGWQALEADQVQLPPNLAASFRSAGDWFVSSEAPSQPKIGDLRVRFEIIPEGALTVVARQQAGVLGAWNSSRGQSLLLVERGEHTAKAMIDDAGSRNVKAGWALRFAGFVIGWVGFSLLLRPLAVLADVVPFLGRLVGGGLAIVSAILAGALSLVAIASGWLWYRPWLLGIVVALVVALVVWILMRRPHGSPPPPPPQPGDVAPSVPLPSRPPPPPIAPSQRPPSADQ